jgi:hypothetical protein
VPLYSIQPPTALVADWLTPFTAALRPNDYQVEARASSKIPGMTIKIPVKPYTRKFLAFYLGENYEMRLDDPYGLFLFILFQKNLSNSRRETSLGRYTQSWGISTCEEKLRKKGYKGLTNLTIVHFNNFVEGVCKAEFHSAAALYQKFGQGTIETAIQDFMEKFGLTADDIDPMTLRRSYIRYRRNNIDRDKLQVRLYKKH